MALSRLIVDPIDGHALQVAIQQGSHSTMRDNGEVSTRMLCHNVLHGAQNTRLGINRGFPAFEACFRFGEESVRSGLKKRRLEKAGCTSVVFSRSESDICYRLPQISSSASSARRSRVMMLSALLLKKRGFGLALCCSR